MGLLTMLGVKQIDKGLDLLGGFGRGIDKLHFSEQEKAELGQAKIKLWYKWAETQNQQNSVRSKARRVLAFAIISSFLANLWAAAGMYFYNVDYSEFLFDVLGKQSFMAGAVVVFYFGYYGLEKFKKK